MTSQVPLDFDPAPVRLPLPDERITREDRPRLHKQALLILERLQAGPARNVDLVLCGGGYRYSARIEELRKCGHHIESERQAGGVWLYRLVTA